MSFSGGERHCDAADVVVPATWGVDKGIRYRIERGVRALLVADEAGVLRVYPMVEPASRWYATMTKSDWMPRIVVGETTAERGQRVGRRVLYPLAKAGKIVDQATFVREIEGRGRDMTPVKGGAWRRAR